MPRIKIQWIVALLFVALIIGLRFMGLDDYFTLASIKAHSRALENFVAGNYALSVALFIGLYSFLTMSFLPLASVMSVVGGFLYGTLFGVLFTNIGATIGGTLSFLIVRYLIGDSLQKYYAARLQKINVTLEREQTTYLLVSRLISVIPFSVLNILLGLTRVPLSTFMWTTSLGIIPGSAVYCFAGSRLQEVHSLRDIFSGQVLLAFVLLAALGLVPTLVKKIWRYYNGA